MEKRFGLEENRKKASFNSSIEILNYVQSLKIFSGLYLEMQK